MSRKREWQGMVWRMRNGRLAPGLMKARLVERAEGGEVWAYGKDRRLLVPPGPKVVWRGRRLLVVEDGEVVACGWRQTGYPEGAISELVRGVVVRQSLKELRTPLNWKLIALCGAIGVGVVLIVMYVVPRLTGGG